MNKVIKLLPIICPMWLPQINIRNSICLPIKKPFQFAGVGFVAFLSKHIAYLQYKKVDVTIVNFDWSHFFSIFLGWGLQSKEELIDSLKAYNS